MKLPEVLDATGLSKSTLYRMLEDREFPRARRLGKRGVGWPASLVEQWIENLEPVGGPDGDDEGEA